MCREERVWWIDSTEQILEGMMVRWYEQQAPFLFAGYAPVLASSRVELEHASAEKCGTVEMENLSSPLWEGGPC